MGKHQENRLQMVDFPHRCKRFFGSPALNEGFITPHRHRHEVVLITWNQSSVSPDVEFQFIMVIDGL